MNINKLLSTANARGVIMNLKSVYKYQMSDFKKLILVFYLVIACGYVLLGTLGFAIYFNQKHTEYFSFSIITHEIVSIIFLFTVGLGMFRETFRMSMQNGVSRKKIWTGTVLSFLTVSGVMALVDTLSRMALIKFGESQPVVHFCAVYDLAYGARGEQNNVFQNVFEEFLLNFCLYTAALVIGYFVIIGFYRMNKIAKIVVPMSTAVFLIFVLPILIYRFTHTYPVYIYYDAARLALSGSNHDNPFCGMGSGILVSAVFLGLTYLMIRRAPIKD